MSSCITDTCGTGDWTGPLPGDPDNNSILSAVSTFGGIDVSWTYPNINPHAVAHVLLYRGITSNYAASVKQATVTGSTFYDRITGTTGTRYYYWIQIVSVNGTVGAVIGPASAINRGRIEDLIADLSGKLEESELGLSLRTSLGRITSNYNDLLGRIGAFSGNNQAFMDALADVQSGLTGALTVLNTEVIERTSGQNALLSQQTVLAALNQVNAAAILEEQTVRVTIEDALAQVVLDIEAVNNSVAAAVRNIESSKIGYSALVSSNAPYEGDGSTVVYAATTYPTSAFPDYALNRTRIIDKLGVTLWNALPANSAKQLVWVVGLPLAQAIKSIGISDGSEFITLEQRATAQKTTNGNLLAQYTVKIDSGGYITGYGLASTVVDGIPTSSFKINANYFSIAGPTVPGQTRPVLSPFIVDTANQTVLINNAMIKKLTADNIDTTQLNIKDANGNIIFSSGVNLDWSRITGEGKTTNDLNIINATETADAAKLAADFANVAISNIGNDSIITPGEKPVLKAEYDRIVSEQAGISALSGATASQKSNYAGAITQLTAYLGTLSGWNVIPGENVAVNNGDLRGHFSLVYLTRQNLLNAVSTSAASTANWSEIVNTGGKPANYADVTADNIAAGITGQGTLATENGVGIGANVYIWNPAISAAEVLNTTDFVNRLSKIGTGNISTFIADAAIGNAYIGNLAVSTLKIADNAVTVVSMGADAVTVILAEAGTVAVTAAVSAKGGTPAGGLPTESAYFAIHHSSGVGAGSVSLNMAPGYAYCIPLTARFNLPAGTHTFNVAASSVTTGLGTLTLSSILTAQGAMK